MGMVVLARPPDALSAIMGWGRRASAWSGALRVFGYFPRSVRDGCG